MDTIKELRIWETIDLDAITHNIDVMCERLEPGTSMMAVIKANGYGHGAQPLMKHLEAEDRIAGYAVATAEEALELFAAGATKMILILGYVFSKDYADLIRAGIRLTVFTYEMAEEISKAATELGVNASIHIKIDTGMHRIGFAASDTSIADIVRISKLPHIVLEGIFTHFARADEADKSDVLAAYDSFVQMVDALEAKGIVFFIRHCSNSASILEMPGHHMDMVRAGITLYGLWPSDEVDHSFALRPVLSLYSRIVYLKEIPSGCPISYGGTFVTKRASRIATIPVGYADGYPRSLSNKGYVLIRGKRAPIVGRVCMDQLMVDVTDIPDASEQDLVTLIGTDGEESITAEELGTLSGRFNYELVCDFGVRVMRFYEKESQEVYALCEHGILESIDKK